MPGCKTRWQDQFGRQLCEGDHVELLDGRDSARAEVVFLAAFGKYMFRMEDFGHGYGGNGPIVHFVSMAARKALFGRRLKGVRRIEA